MFKKIIKRILSTFYNIFLKIKYKNIHIGYKCRILYGTKFEGFNTILDNTVFGGSIGSNSYIGENCFLKAAVGRYCSIANRVHSITGMHPTKKFVSTSPVFFSPVKKNGNTYVSKFKFEEVAVFADKNVSVIIGNDVWIGENVSFIGKIEVGDGAIIAANSTVVKDIEPYSIVGGTPARLIRKRFEEEQIEFLLKFKWWNKDVTWIKEHANDFEDIISFMEKNNNNQEEL